MISGMNDYKKRETAAIIKRMLYLNQIQIETAKHLKSLSFLPASHKNCLNSIEKAANAYNRLLLQVSDKEEYRNEIKEELSGENIKDLSLLMDEFAEMENLCEVLMVVKEYKANIG